MNDSQSQINWFPGHMAKTRRLLSEQIRRTDLVIEICDARLPYSSRNPELRKLTEKKAHLLFLNKADLSDPEKNQQWLRYFRDHNVDAHLLNSVRMREKEIIGIVETATEQIIRKAHDRGIKKTVKAMVIGIPNVGKSTFINHLNGKKIAAASDRPGVTKSNQWFRISPYLEILDTPGLLWPRLDDQTAARRLCYIGSIRDDVVDLAELTIHLLEELIEIVPEKVQERFHVNDPDLRGPELLDAVCRGRGWLLKGNQFDYDRCCNVVMNEFRDGKLGRITLETPDRQPEKENQSDD